jgi:predicted peptidase
MSLPIKAALLATALLLAHFQPLNAQTAGPTPAPTADPATQPAAPEATAAPAIEATAVVTATSAPTATVPPAATDVATSTTQAAPAMDLGNGHATGQHAHVFQVQIGKRSVRLNYLLYVPASYGQDPYAKYPLVVFLHGSRETGKDINRVKKAVLPARLESEADFPAIVLSPQSPVQSWDGSVPVITALLDELEADFSIDPDRVYVSGLSMGAYGAWALAMKNQDRFAAIVSVVGGYFYSAKQLCVLKDIPIWVFAGKKDRNVNPKESVAIVNALEKCGGKPRFTFYEDANHDQGWQRAYADPEFFAWLLEQRRSGR